MDTRYRSPNLGPEGGLRAVAGWHGSIKPTGRTAPKRDMVVLMPSALGDLGLDLLNAATEKVGHIGDRHAVSHKLVRSATEGRFLRITWPKYRSA